MNIEILSGSPRTDSITHRIALFLQRYLQQKSQHNVGIIDVRDWDVPSLLQSGWSSPEKAPKELRPLAERMFAAEAFILLSPEYNGSYSGALKNLLDHFPKQTRKPFGIATASPGALGGIRAAQQMQLLVAALFGIGSPYMMVVPTVQNKFDEEGNLIDDNFQKSIDVFVTEFLWLSESINPVVEPAELL
jgi:NAD(P)H-dependent FMN reductase